MATGFNGAQIYDPSGQYNGGGANLVAAQGGQQRLGSAQNYQQQLGLGAAQYGQASALQGQSLAAQQAMNTQNVNAQLAGYSSQQQIAGIQAAAAEMPAQLQQSRFSQVFPVLSSALGYTGGGAAGQGTSPAGSPNYSNTMSTALAGGGRGGNATTSSVTYLPPAPSQAAVPSGGGALDVNGQLSGTANTSGEPRISDRPVYTNQQIQQQVNQQTAANNQSTATQTRKMQGQVAGRGEGANSPLSQALGMGLQNQNLATNTENAASTRLNSAQANATQRLAGQTAQETQFSNRQNEGIQRAQVYQQYLSSALAAMSGLV